MAANYVASLRCDNHVNLADHPFTQFVITKENLTKKKKILILGQILLLKRVYLSPRRTISRRLSTRLPFEFNPLSLPFNSRVHSPNHFRNHILLLEEEHLNEKVGSSLILPRVTLALVSRGASDRKILIYMFPSYPHPRPSSVSSLFSTGSSRRFFFYPCLRSATLSLSLSLFVLSFRPRERDTDRVGSPLSISSWLASHQEANQLHYL